MVLKGRDGSDDCWVTSDSFWDLHSWFFISPKPFLTFTFVIVLNIFGRYLENELTSFLSVLQINWVNKILRGGWSGFGMVPVGIHPTSIGILNGHPTKIPPDKILGGVVQNCQSCLRNNGQKAPDLSFLKMFTFVELFWQLNSEFSKFPSSRFLWGLI